MTHPYTVGFTGTRQGMTNEQKGTLKIAFIDIEVEKRLVEQLFCFRHGDCVGADAEAHDIWRSSFTDLDEIWIHPPMDPKYRAFKNGDVILDPKGYLDRNDDIVAACHYLIGTPNTMKPKVRGGTWSTIRKAAASKVRGSVILPNGMVVPVSDYE